ncbi:dihydropteroate synthase [Synechocystis sp. LKSZ1]|uniref:dihydropteroate synthase n=1 Tax=Synechocystis sp. LKSZ1 TaxID=3144951 RepID=UPI00336BD28A
MTSVLFPWGQRTYVMGILNTTPDSFSDGGQFNTLESALKQAQVMVQAGADMIDIGGQSTRPGAATISLAEELDRTIPVIQALRSHGSVPISIDTTRAAVAEAAVMAGANWVNDVSGGTFDPAMLATVARLQVPLVLMHLRGTPQTMQQLTDYDDLVSEIKQALLQQVQQALALGIRPENLILDPGLGFAKTAAQNITLLKHLPELRDLGFPLLVGPSRKSFIGKLLEQPDPQQRHWGTAAACCRAIAGGADILRVHDVAEMVQVCRVADALWRD